MKEWWSGLQASEQRTLLIGGIVLAVMGFYFLIWEPVHNEVADLEKQVAEQKAIKAWMQQAAVDVKQMQRSGQRQAISGGRSMLAVVDQTVKRSGLGGALKRLEPEGETAVRVWLEQASFDDVMRWLIQIEGQYGLHADTLTIDRKDIGRTDVRLTLKGVGA